MEQEKQRTNQASAMQDGMIQAYNKRLIQKLRATHADSRMNGVHVLQRKVSVESVGSEVYDNLYIDESREHLPDPVNVQGDDEVNAIKLALRRDDMGQEVAGFSKRITANNHSAAVASIPNVRWSANGLESVKREIMERIELPLKFPHLFKQGIKKRSGVLLYGCVSATLLSVLPAYQRLACCA